MREERETRREGHEKRGRDGERDTRREGETESEEATFKTLPCVPSKRDDHPGILIHLHLRDPFARKCRACTVDGPEDGIISTPFAPHAWQNRWQNSSGGDS